MNVPQSFSITGCVRAHMHAEFGKVLTKQYHRSSFLLLLMCDVAIIINYSFFYIYPIRSKQHRDSNGKYLCSLCCERSD